MRLSTDGDRDDDRSIDTLCTALRAGVRLLDTGSAYGLGHTHERDDAGHNERLVTRAIRASGIDRESIRVVTKVGMHRPDGAWLPDGRASSIAEDAQASRDALGGLPLDVSLLHAIDPRTSLGTSVRALLRELERGTTKAIGLSNVSRTQLEAALKIAPIRCVQVALGAYDDAAIRGGLVRFCLEHDIEVLAHSPLGGPKRAARLSRDRVLGAIARDIGIQAIDLVLSYLSRLHEGVVPLVGARRPETARKLGEAHDRVLSEDVMLRLDARFPSLGSLRRPPTRVPKTTTDREVVLLMGLPGAGKSRTAHSLVGYERLNRDERGGTLKDLARALDARLEEGANALVVDGTYVTRAARNDVVRAAQRHGARVRCRYLETKMSDAQINVVQRMLDRHDRLLGPDELATAHVIDPNMVGPNVLFRLSRELEPPTTDEGFDEIEVVPFARLPDPDARGIGAMIALDVIACEREGTIEAHDDLLAVLSGVPLDAPCLVHAFRPSASEAWMASVRTLLDRLENEHQRRFTLGVCPHAAGPPTCWCRPPLPGLFLEFARRRRLDATKCLSIGASAASLTMARTLGVPHLVVDRPAQ